MGYLICGPVGTGKTFLAECYAGSIGIPCVKLLQLPLEVRRRDRGQPRAGAHRAALAGPGRRDHRRGRRRARHARGGGDSGTSSRVFSMIASQMGDTRYRGKHRLDAADQPARPAARRPQAPGPRRGAHPALLSRGRGGVPRDVRVMAPQEQACDSHDDAVRAPRARTTAASAARTSRASCSAPTACALTRRAARRSRSEDIDRALAGLRARRRRASSARPRSSPPCSSARSCSFLPERWREKVAKPNGRVGHPGALRGDPADPANE